MTKRTNSTRKAMNITFDAKWAGKAAARIASGELEEEQIITMRSRIARALNPYISTAGQCSGTDAEKLLSMIAEVKPKVSKEQAQKGIAWLKGIVHTPSGKVRNTQVAKQFTDADIRVLNECEQVPSAQLVGICVKSFAPLYQMNSNSESFVYRGASWQSGGAFEIVRHAGKQPEPDPASKFAKRFVDALYRGKVGLPGNGDCWYCLMHDIKTGKPVGGKEHIESHIEENYFVPSLLVYALQSAGTVVQSEARFLMEVKKGGDRNGPMAKEIERLIEQHCQSTLKGEQP